MLRIRRWLQLAYEQSFEVMWPVYAIRRVERFLAAIDKRRIGQEAVC
jgi:hypothetical protein